jgi:hypothetical protein
VEEHAASIFLVGIIRFRLKRLLEGWLLILKRDGEEVVILLG